MNNLNDLFQEQIQDLYSAEKQITKALPDMINAARNQELRSALERHLEITKKQKERLEKIGSDLDFKADGDTCKGMKGILAEGEKLVKKEVDDDDLRDAGIIAAAQRVEHYEMAGYGTARTYARMLGHEGVASTLQTTLDEESQTDETLTRIAEGHVNRAAMVGAA